MKRPDHPGQAGASDEGQLATLTIVTSRHEADVIVSMLKAHGIFAHAPEHNTPHQPWIPVNVPSVKIDTARALLAKADPDREKASEAVNPPGRGEIMWAYVKGAVAGIVAILVIAIATHLAGMVWLKSGNTGFSLDNRMLEAALLLSIGVFFGTIAARKLCDLILRGYSQATAFWVLALYRAAMIVTVLAQGGSLTAGGIQIAPSATLIASAYLAFWPHRLRESDAGRRN